MTTTDGSPVRDRPDQVSAEGAEPRHTGLRLTIGILSIVVGLLVLVRPVDTLLFVAVLLGLQLVILGIVRIALAATTTVASGWIKVAWIALGVLTVIAGVVCFIRPDASLFIVALVLAAGWIADGIADLVRAFGKDGSRSDKAASVLLGAVSVVAGLVVAFFPGESLVLLTQTAGVLLLVIGVVTCLSALLRRRR